MNKKPMPIRVNWKRIIFTWILLFLVEVIGACSLWLRLNEPWKQSANSPAIHKLYLLIISFAPFIAFFILFMLPVWISKSCLIVKRAIESAYKNDYNAVRSALFAHEWSVFPQPKYAEIVEILRHLCNDRKSKPEGLSASFSTYIILDDLGDYVLSEEGKEKMTRTVETGWLNAKKAEDLGSPKTFKILMHLVLLVAIIRGIALIIHLFFRH